MGCCGNSGMLDEDSSKSRNPLNARKNVCCTDIVILLVFVAFWVLEVYIAVYSLIRGDARRLLFGYDSFGNTCNKESNKKIDNLEFSGMNTSGKQYVFFMSIVDPLKSMQVCVSECPNLTMYSRQDAVDFYKKTNLSICRYNLNPTDSSISESSFSKTGSCADLPVLASVPVLFRCVPDASKLLNENSTLGEHVRDSVHKFFDIFELDDFIRKAVNDFYICWKHMLVLCFVAVVFASLMVVLIRFLASVMVWLIVILAAVGSIVGTVFLWWTYYRVHTGNIEKQNFHIPLLDLDIDNEKAFLILSIIATVLTVILLLILLILRKRISLVVALFHEAGKCLVDLPLLLIQPLWTFLILLIFFMYWIIVQVHISTLGTATVSHDNGFPSVKYEPELFAKQFWWIHLIGLIWTTEFILACQQYVIAGSVVVWYFTVNKQRLNCPIWTSICNLTMHHIGSVAFGAMIITLVKIPRYILMYIQNKCEASQNACAKCCLKCCICCLWCLEKFLKYINQNAYTVIAISGTNFCSAAQKAFSILTSNVLRVAAINSVGAFMLFLGKIAVMAGTGAVSVVWLHRVDGLRYFAIPVILLCIISFIIAHCFLSVYEMVVDALLLCFCEDCQMNDGSLGREYYMNTSLMTFVKDSSARIEQLNKSQALRRRQADEVDRSANSTELQPIASRS